MSLTSGLIAIESHLATLQLRINIKIDLQAEYLAKAIKHKEADETFDSLYREEQVMLCERMAEDIGREVHLTKEFMATLEGIKKELMGSSYNDPVV